MAALLQRRIGFLCSASLLLTLSGCAVAPAPRVPGSAPDNSQTLLPERFRTPQVGIRSGGRISADDLPALTAAGIVHVIDLTVDEETPDFDEAAAVRAQGMSYDNLPIVGPNSLTRESVVAFDQLLRKVEGPVLVHCASGNRVGALAAMRAALIEGVPVEKAIAEGRRWGLGSLEVEVRNRLQSEH